jgi:CRISPR/Cas system-associated exonuclease Cas4 (RecB family)
MAYSARERIGAERQFPLGRFRGPCARCDPLSFRLDGLGKMNLQVMAATLLVLALLLFLLAARSRRKTGIPAGEVFYQDLPGQPFSGEPLRSDALRISGKPDCLIRTADGTVPVELKKSSKPPARGEVYPNHMIQALAYCALVEDQLKERVPYALVIYAGHQVRRVDFTDARRQWLFSTIHELQLAQQRLTENRSHNHRGRCAGCGVRPDCDQALV